MIRSFAIAVLALTGAFLVAQQPPGLLPPSVINTPQPTAPITPVTLKSKPAAPIEVFEKEIRSLPVETAQAVYSTRSAGAWLVRMNQADGRFLAGLNPTLARPLDGVSELAQAHAAWGVTKLAKFTGDEKTSACAGQAVLALLTLTKVEGTERVPTVAAEKCSRAGFAAMLILAICDLPDLDAKRLQDAEMLGAYLKKQCKDDGSVEGATDAIPGLCFQAILALDRWKPEQWKRDVVTRGVAYYRARFRETPNEMLASAMLPATVELLQRVKSESATDFTFEMADHLCSRQATTTDSGLRLVGGFRIDKADPDARSAYCVHGMAAATQLAVQLKDAARIAKYRGAMVGGLAFCHNLQMTEESCQHFEKTFRSRFLVGGMMTSTTDGNLRVDQTAMLALAQIRYLESGVERGE